MLKLQYLSSQMLGGSLMIHLSPGYPDGHSIIAQGNFQEASQEEHCHPILI